MRKATSQSEFNKMRQEEFVSFYLAREQQGSNIYFVAQEDEGARPMIRRRPFLGIIRPFIIVFSFAAAAFFFIYASRSLFLPLTPALSAYRRIFDRSIAIQNGLIDFRFPQSVFSFHEASRFIKDARRAEAGVPAALSSLFFLKKSHQEDFAEFNRIIFEAASAAVSFMEPLLHLSQSSLTRKSAEEGARVFPAGVSLFKSLSRMKSAKEKIASAQAELSARLNSRLITEGDRRELSSIAPQLLLITANIDRLIEQFELAVWALGVQKPRRFLLALQDVSVPRATGGLIGSYGIMETAGGLITQLSFDDVYNLDGELAVNVAPPAPLEKVAGAWAFRNANWFLDFPLSAEKLAYFYAQAGGSEIDGVIALDKKALARLLDISGPIVAPRHEGIIMSAFNIGELTVARTEFSALRKKDGEFLRVLEDVVFTLAQAFEGFSDERVSVVAKAMEVNFAEKDMMVWLNEEIFQRTIEKNGWDGSVIGGRKVDYLAVAVSNIGGAASAEDTPRIFKETRMTDEGDLIATVAIELKDKQGEKDGGSSRYMRVYVPEGSTLLEASGNVLGGVAARIAPIKEGFLIDDDVALGAATLRMHEQSHTEIFKESGRMVLGGWAPEKAARIIYSYKLPFRVAAGGEIGSHAIPFLFQKQPGMDAFLHFSLSAPEGKVIIPDAQSGIGSEFSGDLSRDKAFTLTIK